NNNKEGNAADDKGKNEARAKDQDAAKDKEKGKDGDKQPPVADKDKKDKRAGPSDDEKDKNKEDVLPKTFAPLRPRPGKEREPIAAVRDSFEKAPGVLLTRKADEPGPDSWARALSGAKVFSSDTLLALPGFACVVESTSGMQVLLRGMIPHFLQSPTL